MNKVHLGFFSFLLIAPFPLCPPCSKRGQGEQGRQQLAPFPLGTGEKGKEEARKILQRKGRKKKITTPCSVPHSVKKQPL